MNKKAKKKILISGTVVAGAAAIVSVGILYWNTSKNCVYGPPLPEEDDDNDSLPTSEYHNYYGEPETIYGAPLPIEPKDFDSPSVNDLDSSTSFDAELDSLLKEFNTTIEIEDTNSVTKLSS